MNENNDADSDTDVSSNSSWTVLDETAAVKPAEERTNNQQDNEVDDSAFTISTHELFPDVEILADDIFMQQAQPADVINEPDVLDAVSVIDDNGEEEEPKSDTTPQYGCLTLDEYLKEREVIHDYEYDEKQAYFDEMVKAKPKREKRKRKKCKSDTVGTLAIIGTVLAIAGVSFLCLLTPKNYTLTREEVEKVKTSFNTAEAAGVDTSVPAFPVLENNGDNKVTIADRDKLLEKCFKKNATSPQQAKKYLKATKQFKAVKTINLLNDDAVAKMSGPVSYEEFIEQNKRCLNSFKNEQKKVQDILDKAPLFQKTKTDNSLQTVKEAQNNEVFHPKVTCQRSILKKSQPDSEVLNSKAFLKPELLKKLAMGSSSDIEAFTKQKAKLDRTTRESKEKISNLPMKVTDKPKTVKFKPSTSSDREQLSINVAASQNDSSTSVSHGKLVCGVIHDIMLLRVTSKIARRLYEKQEEKSVKIKRKTLRLKKQKPSTASIPESQAIAKIKKSSKSLNTATKNGSQKTGRVASSTLKLLDELPFSKSKRSRKIKSGTHRKTPMVSTTKGTTVENTSKIEDCSNATTKKDYQDPNGATTKLLRAILTSQDNLRTREKLTRDVKNLKRKQAEFLENLKKQQSDRMKYLQLIKERQQQSIQALMKERRTQICKDVACGRYDVPIPNANEVNKRLLELSAKQHCAKQHCASTCSSLSLHTCAQSCCNKETVSECKIPHITCCTTDTTNACHRKIYKCEIPKTGEEKLCQSEEGADLKWVEMSKVLDDRIASNSAYRKKKPETSVRSNTMQNMCFRIPPEYIDMKKKYYERVGSYWRKREEYLSQRIDFIKEVSSSITEIMNNHRNSEANVLRNISNSEPILAQVVAKAVSAFPDDYEIRKLGSKIFDLQESAKTSMLQISDQSQNMQIDIFNKPERAKSLNRQFLSGTLKETDSRDSCGSHANLCLFEVGSSQELHSPVFEFTANQSNMIIPKSNSKMKKDTLYNYLFGKIGQSIRKKDMAFWYCNRVTKRKRLREFSTKDLRRSSRYKKAKREL